MTTNPIEFKKVFLRECADSIKDQCGFLDLTEDPIAMEVKLLNIHKMIENRIKAMHNFLNNQS